MMMMMMFGGGLKMKDQRDQRPTDILEDEGPNARTENSKLETAGPEIQEAMHYDKCGTKFTF